MTARCRILGGRTTRLRTSLASLSPTPPGAPTARTAKKAHSARALRDAAQKFKLIGNLTRLRILEALSKGASDTSSFTRLTEMTQPAVGHHLAMLPAANFIKSGRDGTAVIYTLTELGRTLWELAEKVMP